VSHAAAAAATTQHHLQQQLPQLVSLLPMLPHLLG
jgi:hypothetical protein